ncbi:MAG: PH domain-containing protein [Myxococcota bacterium]
MSPAIVEGRLDARTVPLRILERLGRFAIVLVALVLNDPSNVIPWVLFIGASTALSLVEVARTRYRLTREALEIESGVLTRRLRRIPLDRIHDLGTEATPLRRAFGVVTLTVETAGSSGAEARLDAVAPASADALRDALASLGTTRAQDAAALPATPLHAARPGDLLLVGLTDNRAGVIVAGAFVLAERLGNVAGLSLDELVARGAEAGQLEALAPSMLALLGLGLLVALVALGWGTSALLTYARFAGFCLEELPGEVLRRRFGLLTTRELSVPRRRLQILRLEESPLRLLVRRAVVRADTAGQDPKGNEGAGLDVFVPAARPTEAAALLPRLLPGAFVPARWEAVSGLVILRSAVRGGLLAALLGVALLAGPGLTPALLFLPTLPALGALLGALAHRRLGWALTGTHLALRWGRLGRFRAWVPRDRVQGVTLTATPFDRRAGIVTLRLYVLGGAQLALPYLPEADARGLVRFLVGPEVER